MASSTRLPPQHPLARMHSAYNPIQLAAITNYKLAQLTFAAPDGQALLKTTLAKNMLDHLYQVTPAEWLEQMTRWKFFTPESLGMVTAENIESMLQDYTRAMHAANPLEPEISSSEEEEEDEDDADEWVDEDTPATSPHESETNLFTQPNASMSMLGGIQIPRDIDRIDPAPLSPKITSFTKPVLSSERRRQSLHLGNTPQTLAGDLTKLFNMDFSVDKLEPNFSTPPTLPELSFSDTSSTLPSFEDTLSFIAPNANRSVSRRSSSLRHAQNVSNATLVDDPKRDAHDVKWTKRKEPEQLLSSHPVPQRSSSLKQKGRLKPPTAFETSGEAFARLQSVLSDASEQSKPRRSSHSLSHLFKGSRKSQDATKRRNTNNPSSPPTQSSIPRSMSTEAFEAFETSNVYPSQASLQRDTDIRLSTSSPSLPLDSATSQSVPPLTPPSTPPKRTTSLHRKKYEVTEGIENTPLPPLPPMIPYTTEPTRTSTAQKRLSDALPSTVKMDIADGVPVPLSASDTVVMVHSSSSPKPQKNVLKKLWKGNSTKRTVRVS
ncbi:hypothetical protein BZG36_00452 [Bifiguratus adelaidae]|uniref:Uncharacterized protein n=1 Tax=Bifiguratus adelaidae TaxID=1938954 RepID=A0A261Y7U1_9FUNG|nr:hypothetical protein BZG36_00452 [Bifiguratus adelaidae]